MTGRALGTTANTKAWNCRKSGLLPPLLRDSLVPGTVLIPTVHVPFTLTAHCKVRVRQRPCRGPLRRSPSENGSFSKKAYGSGGQPRPPTGWPSAERMPLVKRKLSRWPDQVKFLSATGKTNLNLGNMPSSFSLSLLLNKGTAPKYHVAKTRGLRICYLSQSWPGHPYSALATR